MSTDHGSEVDAMVLSWWFLACQNRGPPNYSIFKKQTIHFWASQFWEIPIWDAQLHPEVMGNGPTQLDRFIGPYWPIPIYWVHLAILVHINVFDTYCHLTMILSTTYSSYIYTYTISFYDINQAMCIPIAIRESMGWFRILRVPKKIPPVAPNDV